MKKPRFDEAFAKAVARVEHEARLATRAKLAAGGGRVAQLRRGAGHDTEREGRAADVLAVEEHCKVIEANDAERRVAHEQRAVRLWKGAEGVRGGRRGRSGSAARLHWVDRHRAPHDGYRQPIGRAGRLQLRCRLKVPVAALACQ